MWCVKCNKDLMECSCEDLQERLNSIKKCKYLCVSPEKMKKYEEQAEKHKDDKTIQK